LSGTTRPRPPGVLAGAAAIWTKEMLVEARARYSIGASIVFAAVTLAVLSYTAGPQARRPETAAVLLWMVLLFSATASLSHAFGREVEGGTWDLLRHAAGPGEVLLGKWLAGATVLVAIEALVLAGGALLVAPPVGHPAGLAAVLGAGTVTLAIGLPVVAALLAQARHHGGLAAALAFPVLVPGLFAAVSGTRRALEGAWPGSELRVLVSFAGVLAIAGWRLFVFLWED